VGRGNAGLAGAAVGALTGLALDAGARACEEDCTQQ